MALAGIKCQSSRVDRYGTDVLNTDWRQPPRGRTSEVPLELGLVVEDAQTGFCGAVVRYERAAGTVDLEDRKGRIKSFNLGPGFWIDGKPVALVAPKSGPAAPTRTASGSVAVRGAKAKVAVPSRLFVEGRHDAELIEKVWGDDLRHCGVAVEILDGADNLLAVVRDFDPAPERRMGVMLDHLVRGSKESRIAAQVADEPDVLVVGHPFVDVWQAVKPERVGLKAWPQVPRGTDIKVGSCRALGWPHASQADLAHAWKRILGQVRSIGDLAPEFSGRVEELIDFATVP